MLRHNAIEEKFSEATLLGKQALFTSIRIERKSVPAGCFLYELRHADDASGDVAEVARSILVNFYGSVIMREQLILPESGRLGNYLVIEDEALNFEIDDSVPRCNSVDEFIEKYPESRFTLLSTTNTENDLFYWLSLTDAEKHGAIGYLRGDFGKSRDEFWTTWFDFQAGLKTDYFKNEFDFLMNFLDKVTVSPPDVSDPFEKDCYANMQRKRIGAKAWFKVQTDFYSYYVRFHIAPGDYDFYVFAYDNAYHLDELSKGKGENNAE